MPACTVRQAAAADAPAIEILYRELVSDGLICVLPEQIAALAAGESSYLLVAETGRQVCGTALLTICPDAMYRTQPFGVMENVIVTESQRRRGIGRLLLRRIEWLAADRDCSKLMLLSGRSRHQAHDFFQSCGFDSDAKHAFVKYRRQFNG